MSAERSKINRSLRACVKEGVAAQVMTGIFDYYLNPLAIFMRASTLQIGLLASVPAVLSSLSQVFAVASVRWVGSRKPLLTWGAVVQALLLLPIPFLLFLPEGTGRLEWLIGLVAVFRVLGSLMGPAWGSLVSDYLPEHLRGAYFGKRAQIISIAGVAGMALWGVFLSLMKGHEPAAFFIVFLSAAVCRFISAHYMRQLVELPPAETAGNAGGDISDRNFGHFVGYMAAITFATQLVAPYTSVYMLSDLKFTYFQYMAVNLASTFTGLISFPAWGRNADMVGNVKVMKLSGWLIPLTPLFYMLAHDPAQLIMIEVFNGFIWGGFNLCATNFIYDAAAPQKRVQYLCYFNVANGVALFAGASLGGILAAQLPPVMGSRLFLLFFLSAACRFAAQAFIFPRIQEVRSAYHKVNSSKLFVSVLGIRPLLGHDVEKQTLPDPWHRGAFHALRGFLQFFARALAKRP